MRGAAAGPKIQLLGALLASLANRSGLGPSGDEPEHSLTKHQNHSKYHCDGREHRSGRRWNHMRKHEVHRIHSNRLISYIGAASRSGEQKVGLIDCTFLENLRRLMGGSLELSTAFKAVSSRESVAVVDMPVLKTLCRYRARPTQIGFSPSPAGIPSPLRAYEWFEKLAERSSRRKVGNDRR
jgi:hypothetical protein